MFRHGEDCYNFCLRQVDPVPEQETDKSVSSKDIYAYRLMIRDDEFNQHLRFNDMINQFMMDIYSNIEAERLLYIRKNQQNWSRTIYPPARCHESRWQCTKRLQIILPSSFTGSSGHMHKRTQDAMAYVRRFVLSDLFIMFTFNAKWKEILD